MAKLLFLAGIVFLLVLWFKSKGRSRGDLDAKRGAKRDAKAESSVEDMVRCQVCGVNLPRSEAILSRDRLYCCDEHRQRDAG